MCERIARVSAGFTRCHTGPKHMCVNDCVSASWTRVSNLCDCWRRCAQAALTCYCGSWAKTSGCVSSVGLSTGREWHRGARNHQGVVYWRRLRSWGSNLSLALRARTQRFPRGRAPLRRAPHFYISTRARFPSGDETANSRATCVEERLARVAMLVGRGGGRALVSARLPLAHSSLVRL